MDLLKASAAEIAEAVRTQKIKAVEVARFFQQRTQKLNERFNAFVAVNESVEKEAAAIDAKVSAGENPGALAGVPVAVKDIFCTRGLRTTAASKILGNFVPPYSATVIEKMKAQGAVVLGKTNMDEFAMGSSNENSHFGPVKNPWNTEYVPGGSSGGSAAAVAARLAPIALGTDTGGSIRQPAHFSGIFGLKPTYGRVSRYGIIAFASSLDQAGPMSRTVKDSALLLESIAGKDGFDSTSAHQEVPQWSSTMDQGVRGLKIGLPKEYFTDGIDPDVQAGVERAIQVLKEAGVEFHEVSLPLTEHAVAVYYLVATSEASSNLSRYDGVRYGYRADFEKKPAKDLVEFYSRTRAEGFGSEVKRRIMLGTYALSSGYYDAYYQKASQVRRLMRDHFAAVFKQCDAILSPVAMTAAFKLGERVSDPLQMYFNDIFTTSVNLAGLPGASVPAGFTKLGLPTGVQLMAGQFREDILFRIAKVLEQELSLQEKMPDGLS